MLFIGIDLGTSAVKLLLVGADGAVLRTVSRDYPLSFPHPGWSEQSPADWWDACVSGIRELLRGFDGRAVAGIGLGGQMHGRAGGLPERGCRQGRAERAHGEYRFRGVHRAETFVDAREGTGAVCAYR